MVCTLKERKKKSLVLLSHCGYNIFINHYLLKACNGRRIWGKVWLLVCGSGWLSNKGSAPSPVHNHRGGWSHTGAEMKGNEIHVEVIISLIIYKLYNEFYEFVKKLASIKSYF